MSRHNIETSADIAVDIDCASTRIAVQSRCIPLRPAISQLTRDVEQSQQYSCRGKKNPFSTGFLSIMLVGNCQHQ
jgi:hypothetical protein